jgi:hypothetical protein
MTNLESLVRQLIENGDLFADDQCSCQRCRTIVKIKAELSHLGEGAPRAHAHEPEGEPDEPVDYAIEDAIRIAGLWRAGKMIGGDQDGVRDALLAEVERLRVLKPPGESGADLLEKARAWITQHAAHDESNGPCYGRRFAAPDPDQAVHTCRCGLDELRSALNRG